MIPWRICAVRGFSAFWLPREKPPIFPCSRKQGHEKIEDFPYFVSETLINQTPHDIDRR